MSFQSAINSMASNMANLTNSYVASGSAIPRSARATPQEAANFDTYFEFLGGYHFVTGLLDIFVSTLSETIKTTSFKVSVADEKDKNGKLAEKLNSFIDEIDLKNRILEDLESWVYRGAHFYSLDIKNKELISVKDPYSFKILKKRSKLVGYLYNGKYVKLTEGVGYWYKKDDVQNLPKSKVISKSIVDKKDYKSDNQFAIEYSVFSGKSIFRSQLIKIYQTYVLEYILYFLGLRDSIKPDILSMTFPSTRTDISQAAIASDRIESLLNQPSAAMTSVIDPVAFINQLNFVLLNHIKVVPNVDNFNSLNELGTSDLSSRRARLTDELESNKKQILNNLTVPEEVYSGNSNRWEVMSRNDRWMTTINNQLQSVTRFVKDTVIARAKEDNVNLSYSDVIFSLEMSSFLASYEIKNKMSNVTERLSEVTRLVEMVESLVEKGPIKKDNFIEYIKDQLSAMDASIAGIINFDKLMSADKSSDEPLGQPTLESTVASLRRKR